MDVANSNHRVVEAWLDDFDAALARAEPAPLAKLFVDDSYWRDLVAFTWDIGFRTGAAEIARALIDADSAAGATGWRIAERLAAPRAVRRAGRDVLEAFIEFRTAAGRGTGVLRLDTGDGRARARILMTRLDDVAAPPHLLPSQRPAGVGYEPSSNSNWSDFRRAGQEYPDRSPEVLVVGGGHSGMFMAAHLNRLGVDNLVVDKLARIGDNWRNRYHSLALHNKTDMVHFPYLPFPDNFPEYLPKDKFANWFETYADAMEINYWTSTTFVGGTYDDDTARWSVQLDRDGVEVQFQPRHIVIATGGVGGTPNIPALPGLDAFDGPVLHTKDFTSGADFASGRVLVVGVGSSAHDVADDLHRHGAQPTMLQRRPASVVDLDSANMWYPQYGDGPPIDEADLLATANFIQPLLTGSLKSMAAVTNERDRDLHAALERAGMTLDHGESDAGWLMKFYERSGGYYINVGCSEKIIDGSIGILQLNEVDRFDDRGVVLRDGSRRDFDAVVMATGYQNQQTELRRYFGDKVADKVGPVWGWDDDLEMRNAWRPTPQPGLWLMLSSISQARVHSPLVALQIRGALDGIAVVPQRLARPSS